MNGRFAAQAVIPYPLITRMERKARAAPHQPLAFFAGMLAALIQVMQQRIRLVDQAESIARGRQPLKSRNCFKF